MVADRPTVGAADRDIGTAHIAVLAAIEVPVGVKIVERVSPSSGRDERIETLVFKEQLHVGAALVRVVFAYHAAFRVGIVWLADFRQQHEMDVGQAEGSEDNEIGGLLDLLAGQHVDVGDPRSLLA
jgi:hypothetical protein